MAESFTTCPWLEGWGFRMMRELGGKKRSDLIAAIFCCLYLYFTVMWKVLVTAEVLEFERVGQY